jgi:zinc and cadmium transporter
VAVADLLPQLQQRLAWRQTLAQIGWLAAGLAVVMGAMLGLHGATP